MISENYHALYEICKDWLKEKQLNNISVSEEEIHNIVVKEAKAFTMDAKEVELLFEDLLGYNIDTDPEINPDLD